MDDDVGALDVERAVTEREGADFNAGVAFDLQRLGAHGLGDGVDSDGAAVNRRVVAFAFASGHDLRRVGLDGTFDRGKRDRADGNVAARDRLNRVDSGFADHKLVGFTLDGFAVGLLERLKLLFVQRAEEVLEVPGVVVLRPLGGVERDLLVVIGDAVIDLCKGGLDEVLELFNLDGRRHLEGRRIEREAAERQGGRVAMFCEVVSRLSLVVGNRELGVVVDRNGAELGDIPRTLIFRVGIAFGAGLGSGGFFFPDGLVVGERDAALIVVAVGNDLAVLTLLEGLSLAEGEGGAGGEVLVLPLRKVELAVLGEGAHGEALVDGERAALGHGNEVGDGGASAGIMVVHKVVDGESALVTDGDGTVLLGVDGAPGGCAVDLCRAGVLGDGEARAAVKSAFLIDEIAVFIERDIVVGHADARFGLLVVFAFLLVGFGLELVALVFVREGGVRERDVAHEDRGGDGLKVGVVGEAVDRHVRLVVGVSARDFDLALGVVKAARHRQVGTGLERAVVDERAAFSDVKADVERQAGKFVGELAGSLVGLVLADRDLVTVLALDRDLAGGVREVLVEGLGPVFVPGLFVLDGVGDGVGSGTDGQRDVLVDRLGHGACGEDGERGQDGRDERLPGEGGVAH